MRINNKPGDKGGLLDLTQKTNLVSNLCSYTMRMIADKNPDGGDAVGLREAAVIASRGIAFI